MAILVDTKGLTDSENLKLRVLKAKSKFRKMGIEDVWTFYKHYYPNHNNDDGLKHFRLCINTQQANEEVTKNLENLLETLKRD